MHRIDSTANPRVKEWKSLRTAKGRAATGTCLLEGPHLVHEAVRAGAGTAEILLRDGAGEPPWLPASVRVTTVSAAVMRAVCDSETPQGIAAICEIPPAPASLGVPQLLLDAVQDPGNVGSLIRSAAAAGCTAVVLGEGCADPWSPKALRASQGAVFHLAVVSCELVSHVGALRDAGITVLGSAMDGVPYVQGPSYGRGSYALLLGNEGAGIAPELLAACDRTLAVPLENGVESLGVAVAGAVLLFRLRDGGIG